MPQTPHTEKHFTASEVVRDIVIGMSDRFGCRYPPGPSGIRLRQGSIHRKEANAQCVADRGRRWPSRHSGLCPRQAAWLAAALTAKHLPGAAQTQSRKLRLMHRGSESPSSAELH